MSLNDSKQQSLHLIWWRTSTGEDKTWSTFIDARVCRRVSGNPVRATWLVHIRSHSIVHSYSVHTRNLHVVYRMQIVMERFKQLMFHSFTCPGRMSWLVSLHVRRDRQARSAKSEAKKGTTETWSQTIIYMSVTDFWLSQLPSGSCCAHSVNSFFPEGLEGAQII